MALLGVFTLVAWICMGTLLVKLWSRWRRDRELLKSEDDEALMILRKESQLRKSFSESYPTLTK